MDREWLKSAIDETTLGKFGSTIGYETDLNEINRKGRKNATGFADARQKFSKLISSAEFKAQNELKEHYSTDDDEIFRTEHYGSESEQIAKTV